MMAGQMCLLRPVDLSGLRVCKSPLRRRVSSQRRILGASCAVSSPAQDRENVKNAGVSWGCDVYSVETANACQEWLAREGLPPPKVAVKKVDAGGRGMVAARKIRRGELVISVPSSAIITVNSRWSSSEIGEIMKREEVPEWPMLATYLVSEASLGKTSRWSLYIDSLPQQPSSILQWYARSLADVNKYLSASCTRIRATECISDVNDVFESLRAKIFSKWPELFPPQVFQLGTFTWAFGILFSRAVRLPTLGQVALVPLADMFNHSTEAKTFLDFNPSSVSVQLAAGQDYDEGQQVFNSYGKRSSSELLIAYGFVPSEVNDEDAVELSLALDPQDGMYEAKLNALKESALATFPVRKDGLATQMLAYARLVVGPAELEPTFKQMAIAASENASAKQDSLYLSQLALATDIQAHEHLLATCEAAISSYTHFLKGKEKLADNVIDEATATSEFPKERAQWLMQNAVLLCMNERRILYRMQTVLRSRLRELRAAVAGGADPDSPVKASSPGLFSGIRSLLGR